MPGGRVASGVVVVSVAVGRMIGRWKFLSSNVAAVVLRGK